MSQLIPTDRPVLQRGNNAKNDMSLWGGVVVGTQDFAPAPAAKQQPASTWKWIAGGLALVIAGIAAFLIVSSAGDKPAPSAANAVAPTAPEVKDAGVAAVTPDTAAVVAVADAGVDAAPTVAAVTGQVDAISGAAAIIKPAKKKGVRKAAVKKKSAPKKKVAPKRR